MTMCKSQRKYSVTRVLTRSSYGNELYYGLSMFVEFEKLPYPSVIQILIRFYKPSHLLYWNLLNKVGIISKFCFYSCADLSELTSTVFLIISYFIVAHCTFTRNFSSKLKPQFQVIFGQDSIFLNISSFQASLLQKATNCLFTNGWWNACFYNYSFYKKVSHLFLQALGLSKDISLLLNRQFCWSSLIILS